jgi:uncharacterized protein
MLRGPQTPGELKQRTERLHRFGELADLHRTLDALGRRELAERLARRPGQKEERYRHLLGGDAPTQRPPESPAERREWAAEVHETPVRAASPAVDAPSQGGLETRLEALEAEVRRLRADLEAVHSRLDV